MDCVERKPHLALCSLLALLATSCFSKTSASPAAGADTEATGSTGVTDPSSTSNSAVETASDSASETNATSNATTSVGADTDSSTTSDVDPSCNIWEQDCPVDEKCTAIADGLGGYLNICVEVSPTPGQVGDTCTEDLQGGQDDCAIQSICVAGTCATLCAGTPANPVCDDPSTSCAVYGGALPLCQPSCDPLQQDCEQGDGCYPDPQGDVFVCRTDASGEFGGPGDTCDSHNDCDPGLLCADTCTFFCVFQGPMAACPPPLACVAWFQPGQAPPGYENVGACLP